MDTPLFNLAGKWVWKNPNSDTLVIELRFLDESLVKVKVNPGGEKQYRYAISTQAESYIIRLYNLPSEQEYQQALVIKDVDADIIKIQLHDSDQPNRWIRKETKKNTGLITRIHD